MARIRTVKPTFWIDEKIVSVSRDARLMFIGMWNFADDQGVLEYSPIQIKAQVYPLDADLGVKEIQSLLVEMIQAGLILKWEVERKAYIHIRNFNKHQVINKPSFSPHPQPPDYVEHIKAPVVLPEECRRETDIGNGYRITEKNIVTSKEVTRDILPNVTPPLSEKEVRANAKTTADFETWWKAFPSRRKIGKPKCYQKWLMLRRDKKLIPLPEMLAMLERQKRSKDWLKDGGDFIPGPHPYLNQFMFMDESLDAQPTRPVFTPAPPQLTPENVHEYADPNCQVCEGKGMFPKIVKGVTMRVRCECADKKFNAVKGESL